MPDARKKTGKAAARKQNARPAPPAGADAAAGLATERRYSLLFSKIDEGFALHELVLDEAGKPADYRFLEVNPAFEKLTGLKRDVVVGRTIREVAPATPKSRIDAYAYVARTGKTIRLEEFEGAAGRYYSATAFSPRPGQFAVILTDVTERRKAAEALRESEELYRSLFKHMLNGFAYCRMLYEDGKPVDFVYLAVNDAFEAQTGLKGVTGRKISEIVPGIRESDPQIFEIYGRVARTGLPENLETFVKALDMWFSISVYSPARGYFVAVFDVITARKRAEEALASEKKRLDAILDSSPVGLLVMDGDFKIVRANAAAAAIAGVELNAVLRSRFGDVFGCVNSGRGPGGCGSSEDCPPCPLLKGIAELLAGGKPLRGIEARMKLSRGGEAWLLAGAERINIEGRPHAVVSVDDITEKKAAQEAEEKSRSRFAAIFGRSPIAIEYYDGDGLLVGANEACIDMFGVVDISEIAGASLFADPNVSDEVKARLKKQETVQVEAPFDFEKVKELKLYRTTRSGTVFLDYRISPMVEKTKTTGYVVQVQDITQRRAAELRAARRSELLGLINTTGDIHKLLRALTAVLRDWTGCEAVGVRLREGYDYPYFETRGFPEEFVQAESSLCSIGPDGDPALECMCGNVLCGRFDPAKPFFTGKGSFWSNCTTDLLVSTSEADRQSQTRNRCNRDGYESVALIPLRAGMEIIGLIQLNSRQKNRFDKEILTFLEFAADQTALAVSRLKAQEALRESEARLKKAQATAHVGNWEINLKTRAVWASEEARRIYGFSLTEKLTLDMVQKAALARYRPELDAALERLVDGEPGYDQEFEIAQHETGKILWVQSISELTLDSDGEPKVIGVVQDITERKQLESRFRQAQKMEAVGLLAGGVAHDFNNILTAIKGYCALLAGTLEPSDRRREDIGEILAASDRAATLTRQLLAFSRKQIMVPKVVDLNKTLGGMVGMLRRIIGEEIRLSSELSASPCLVKVDPGQLEQVIMNLAVNARDAVSGDAEIVMTTGILQPAEEFFAARPDLARGGIVRVEVRDNGCGMGPEVKKNIFEPFFTTKEQGKGTGLGLSMAYGIMKQSGGEIEVESEPGKGSVFKLYLPLAEAATGGNYAVESAGGAAAGTETVLLVEDEESLRRLGERLLRAAGYTVISAADGREALAAAERHGKPVDLLMTDMVMPGMSGRELAVELERRSLVSRTLYMSGYTADDSIVKDGVLEQGIAFINKPFTAEALSLKLREVLDGPAGQAKA